MRYFRINVFVFLLLAMSQDLFAAAPFVFKQYSKNLYRPQYQGLKDLYVEVRIDRLTEVLNQRLIFGKLKDVHFKLYWSFPDKRIVEIHGMPKGFREAKDELIRLAEAEIEYLLPRNLDKQFSGYSFSYLSKNKKHVLAIDPSYRSPASEVSMKFDKRNILKNS